MSGSLEWTPDVPARRGGQVFDATLETARRTEPPLSYPASTVSAMSNLKRRKQRPRTSQAPAGAPTFPEAGSRLEILREDMRAQNSVAMEAVLVFQRRLDERMDAGFLRFDERFEVGREEFEALAGRVARSRG